MQKESKISLKYYLHLEKGNGELYPLYCRIIVSGGLTKKSKAEISIGRRLKFADWNEAKEEARKDVLLNEELSVIKTKLYRIKRDLEDQGKLYSAKDITDIYKGVNTVVDYTLVCFQQHIDRIRIRKEHTEGTIAKYIRTKERLREYITYQYKLDDYPIGKINYEFISRWEDYLLSQRAHKKDTTLHRNTVNNYHDCFKSVLSELHKEGRVKISPYDRFSYKDDSQHKLPLNSEQLKKLMQLDVSDTRRLDIVKDIFLFSCFTGLRFNDVINLDADKVHQTQSGYYEVTFKQQKTNDYASLPLIRPALEIYRKYDQDFRKITGKAFPSYSNQKFNAYLKEIADLSKINFDRPLTHHVARHTFATTVCIENDIPIEIVSKWLGHKKLQTTNVYAKLQNPLLARHGRDLIDKFKISIDEKG